MQRTQSLTSSWTWKGLRFRVLKLTEVENLLTLLTMITHTHKHALLVTVWNQPTHSFQLNHHSKNTFKRKCTALFDPSLASHPVPSSTVRLRRCKMMWQTLYLKSTEILLELSLHINLIMNIMCGSVPNLNSQVDHLLKQTRSKALFSPGLDRPLLSEPTHTFIHN